LSIKPYNLGILFEEVSRKHADRTALHYDDGKITYRQLNALANQLAAFLREKNVNAGDVVAIVNTKAIYSYAAMLACLKLGAAYTNIDRDNPQVRIESILEQCRPLILLADQEIKPDLLDYAQSKQLTRYILCDLDLSSFSDNNSENTYDICGSRIAYVMFTSGSTGVPKGVAIMHQSVMNFIDWSTDRYHITPDDNFANISPMYFDNSVFDFYSAFFSGASLTPISKDLLSRPKDLLNTIDKQECSIWFSVPSMLIFLMTMRALDENSFRTLRVITFGGEGFPKTELQKLYDFYHSRIEIINVYGPTEGTCICSSHTITSKDFKTMDGFPSLGQINPDFEYVILDDTGATSKQGELCILGPNISIGYYNDAERSKAVFSICFDYGFYSMPMYRTGDLVYEEGKLLYFLGRKDNQIKHMGYRIELEEIELALVKIPGVSQAAVIYERVSAVYGKIIAFVACCNRLTQNEVRESLRLCLPDYMLPNVIEFHDVLPKNPNGKVDKGKLRDNFRAQA